MLIRDPTYAKAEQKNLEWNWELWGAQLCWPIAGPNSPPTPGNYLTLELVGFRVSILTSFLTLRISQTWVSQVLA
jgi:hypothetical protein